MSEECSKKERKALAVITRDEEIEISRLRARWKVASRIFKETNLDEFERANKLVEDCRDATNKWWYDIEEKYGIPHGLVLTLDGGTREIFWVND